MVSVQVESVLHDIVSLSVQVEVSVQVVDSSVHEDDEVMTFVVDTVDAPEI